MKKVVGGKVYDTTTAELIHSYWNGYSTSDFKNLSEVLYRNKKGNFFIVGSGGAMSKYAVNCGNNSFRGSSDNITPVSAAEAIEWLENHDGSEAILSYFTDAVENA